MKDKFITIVTMALACIAAQTKSQILNVSEVPHLMGRYGRYIVVKNFFHAELTKHWSQGGRFRIDSSKCLEAKDIAILAADHFHTLIQVFSWDPLLWCRKLRFCLFDVLLWFDRKFTIKKDLRNLYYVDWKMIAHNGLSKSNFRRSLHILQKFWVCVLYYLPSLMIPLCVGYPQNFWNYVSIQVR